MLNIVNHDQQCTPTQWGNCDHGISHNSTTVLNLLAIGKQYPTFNKAEADATQNFTGRKIIANVTRADTCNTSHDRVCEMKLIGQNIF